MSDQNGKRRSKEWKDEPPQHGAAELLALGFQLKPEAVSCAMAKSGEPCRCFPGRA